MKARYLTTLALTLTCLTGCALMPHPPAKSPDPRDTARAFTAVVGHGGPQQGRENARKLLGESWAKLLAASGMKLNDAYYTSEGSEDDPHAHAMFMQVYLYDVPPEEGPQLEQRMVQAAKDLGWGPAAESPKLSVRTETLYLGGGFIRDKMDYRMEIPIIKGDFSGNTPDITTIPELDPYMVPLKPGSTAKLVKSLLTSSAPTTSATAP